MKQEGIDKKATSWKPFYWGIAIAASIALIARVFLFIQDAEEPRQKIAQQTTPTMQILSAEEIAIDQPDKSIALSEKDEYAIVEAKQHSSSELPAEVTHQTAEETVHDCGEITPYFPGGDRALQEFVKNNLRYPDLAMEYGVRGRVIMAFKVDSTGQASDFKPVKFLLSYDTLYMNRIPVERHSTLKQQIDALLGEEGIRILSLMPRWTPGSVFGKAVSMKYYLPITFNVTDAERQTYLTHQVGEPF